MPDSESPPLFPLFPGRPWLEAVAVGGTLLAANSIAAPQDPGWLALNPTPWLLLPVLSGLAHGFRWGFLFGAVTSAALWAALPILRPAASLPELLFFFSFPVAGLLAGGASRAVIDEKVRERQLRPKAGGDDKSQAVTLQARITALETERSATTARLAACQDELEAVSRQRQTLAAAVTQSQEHAAALDKRAALHEIEARLAAETQASALTIRAVNAEQEAAAAGRSAAVLEDKSRERIAALTADLAARDASLQALHNRLSSVTDQLAMETTALKSVAGERETSAARLGEKEREISQLTLEREALASQLAQQRALAESASQELPDAHQHAIQQLVAEHDSHARRLTARLREQELFLETLTAERDARAAELAAKTNELTKLMENSGHAIQNLSDEREDLASRLAAGSGHLTQLETELRQAIGNLTAERDDLAAQLSGFQQLTAQLEDRDRTIADLITGREELAARLAANHELAAQLQTQREAAENLTAERDELTARLAAQTEEMAGLHGQNHALENRTAEAGDRAAHLDAAQQESATLLASLNTALASITAERDAVADQLLGRDEELHRLKTEHATLTSLLAEAEALAAARAMSATFPSETSSAPELEASESAAEPMAHNTNTAADNNAELLDSLRQERDQLQAQIAELLDTVQSLQTTPDLSDLAKTPELDSAAAPENHPDNAAAQLEALAQQLSESTTRLESLTAERDLLIAKLSDSADSLRRTEEMREALNIRLADRNALLETMATRPAAPPQPRRRIPRSVPLQPRAAERFTTRKVENPGSDAEATETEALDSTEPELFEDFLPPPDPDSNPAAGLDEPESTPAEERIRSFFESGAGPVFPQLLRLLEDIDGVTDAAVYQIDGPRLHRIALHGSEGKLPETLPLDEVEIAHLAVRRQSFVTCRQVLATVPVQSSQWLAALPWPTTEIQSAALLLIHRMHPGAVNRRTFSHLQMLCRWVALFMELHGHPASALSGETDPGLTSDSASNTPATGPITVSSEILQSAIADAAATHREHALPSSSLTLTLTLADNAGPLPGGSPMDVLIDTIRPGLRSTDLLARLPAHAKASAESSLSQAPSGTPAGSTGTTPQNLEILLTFCDFEEAETIARTLADLVRNNSQLLDSVTVSAPTLIGSPANN